MVEGLAGRSFVVSSCLGRGGFGEVYRASMATANGLVSDVAIKVLRADVDPAGQAVQRLKDEAALLATLNHPAILKVVDLVVIEGRVALITEYIEGEDLSVCYHPPDAMPLSALLEAIGTVASALDAAYSWPAPGTGRPLQMVHRDIKPSNIRISRHGVVKLLDFGIARSDEMIREARTQTDLMVGSPAYMAPERFLAAASLPESDVFALGCCIYEGIARERFFADLSVPRMSALALDDDRYAAWLDGRLAKIAADVPHEVAGLLRRLLAYDPEDRGTSAALAIVCDELRERHPGASLSRWARNRGWPAGEPTTGPLEGRTVSESGVLAPTEAAPLPPTELLPVEGAAATAPRARIWPWVVSASLAAAILVSGLLLLTGGAVVYAAWPSAPAVSAPIPVAPPVIVPAPSKSEPSTPAEIAVPPVVKTEPAPRSLGRPPPPADPKPEPAVLPVETAQARLDARSEDRWEVSAVRDGRRTALPAALTPGHYTFEAQRTGELVSTLGEVDVAAGDTVAVRCARFACGLVPK